jgi:acetolactate synthase II small subunit
MRHTLKIQLSGAEGAIIRALGLIERRGFRIIKCSVHEADDDGQAMEVNVRSGRPGDLLKRQLERLHDVRQVELLPPTQIKQKTPGIRPIDNSLSDLT